MGGGGKEEIKRNARNLNKQINRKSIEIQFSISSWGIKHSGVEARQILTQV